jgi:hypothetical protein
MVRLSEIRQNEVAVEPPCANDAGLVFIGVVRTPWIEVVDQDLAWYGNLTAAANMFLGREMTRSFGGIMVTSYEIPFCQVRQH